MFEAQDQKKILDLCRAQNVVLRSATNFLAKNPELDENDAARAVLPKFEKRINRFYFNSIAGDAKRLSKVENGVCFGGKRAWKDFQNGKISKKEWHKKRNNKLVSSGDKNQGGNRNIRISGSEIKVNDTSKRGLWITGKVRFFEEIPDDVWNCYRVILHHEKGLKFRIQVIREVECQTFEPKPGYIGIDVNPNSINWVEVDENGNAIDQGVIKLPRMTVAKKGKRDHDAEMAAIELSNICLAKGKALAHETLDFGTKKKRPRYKKRKKKFNRMRHNFCYRKLLNAINSRCRRDGVPVREVIAAYSSVLGNAKYANQKGMNRHNAAAVVIARRGMGIERERQNFEIEVIKTKKKKDSSVKRSKPRGKKKPRKLESSSSGRNLASDRKSVRLKERSAETIAKRFLRPPGEPVESGKMVGFTPPHSGSWETQPALNRQNENVIPRSGTVAKARELARAAEVEPKFKLGHY